MPDGRQRDTLLKCSPSFLEISKFETPSEASKTIVERVERLTGRERLLEKEVNISLACSVRIGIMSTIFFHIIRSPQYDGSRCGTTNEQ